MNLRVASLSFLALILISVIQLLLLKYLDYSTSLMKWVEPDTVSAATPDPNFQIADVRWNVEYYSTAVELQDFRDFFHSECGGKEGIAAASCLSEAFIERVPFGESAD